MNACESSQAFFLPLNLPHPFRRKGFGAFIDLKFRARIEFNHFDSLVSFINL
jgi:hypothetical protein